MTILEELTSLVVRIQNLRSRIECADDPDMALEERTELRYLLARVEKMQGGRNNRITKVIATIEVDLQKGGVTCYM